MKHRLQACPDFEVLCRTHWPRLCALACKAGCSQPDAEDAVQDVFHKLLRGGQWTSLLEMPQDLQAAHLRLMLRSHLSNAWRDSRRLKRGGHLTIVALDGAEGELEEIAGPLTPEVEHDRAWMVRTLQRALDRLHQESGPREWGLLDAWLGGQGGSLEPACLPGAQRVALHRAKARLRRLIQLEAGAAELFELGLRS